MNRKVLYIGVKSEFGGAGRSLLEMVTTINQMNSDIEPIVLCCHKKGHVNEYLNRGIIAFPSLHGAFNFGREDSTVNYYLKIIPRFISYVLRNIYALLYIETHLDMNSIDLIHTNATRNDIGMILSRIHGIPHIMHLREFGTKGMDYDVKYYRHNPIQFIDNNTDHFIAITNAVKQHWVSQGIDKEKITVVYNGINNHDIVDKNSYSQTGKIRFVFTGYIMETKGQRLLIEALQYIPEDIINKISIDFIGDGNPAYIEKLKTLLKDEIFENCITFLGRREDVHKILHNYDVGLVCSRSEAFGRVTAEYMLAGLTVIASNTGGNPELIDNGVNGLLFDYNKPSDLAEKIVEMVANPNKRIQMSISAKDKAKHCFISEVNASNVVEVYRKIWDQT